MTLYCSLPCREIDGPCPVPDPQAGPSFRHSQGGKLAAVRTAAAGLPRPMVFTNGVFDLLHCGHVSYLRAARVLGASLVVGLNSDESVRSLEKAPGRPVMNERERAGVLGALASVSLVLVFDERTPKALLEALRPEIYVKGGDYDLASLPEARQVAAWGGAARVLPFVEGQSTTRIIERIRNLPSEPSSATCTSKE